HYKLWFLHRLSSRSVFSAFFASVILMFRSRTALQLEVLALRHQLGVLQRFVKRPRLTTADRLFWIWLSRIWPAWRSALVIVKPDTVIAWHRTGFRMFWAWKSRPGRVGRPTVAADRSGPHPTDAPREPVVGCSTYPRRAAQAGYRRG